ncbi:MAG: hypothetical protein JNM65_02450 [Verrucomicrobiaceae bacterium]|nr:hypothetical protein [Verrucomicrobiaceae bacterium]
MILFFSSTPRFVSLVKTKGFSALQSANVLVCDRVPVWPDDLADVANLRFEMTEDVSRFAVPGFDLPEGRWFDIPHQTLDRAAHEIHVQKDP